jgi:hypothetical protein
LHFYSSNDDILNLLTCGMILIDWQVLGLAVHGGAGAEDQFLHSKLHHDLVN